MKQKAIPDDVKEEVLEVIEEFNCTSERRIFVLIRGAACNPLKLKPSQGFGFMAFLVFCTGQNGHAATIFVRDIF
ncbi:MAG: hypothetical protein GY774_11670 [Planctomycetes bacterium]|nr:hypothetical protein [Planctomycetota bacterium]